MSVFSTVPSQTGQRIKGAACLPLLALTAALFVGRPIAALCSVVYEPILISAPSTATIGDTVPVTVTFDAAASTADPAVVTITSSNGSIEGQYTVTSGSSATLNVPVGSSTSGTVTISAYTDGAQTVSTTTTTQSDEGPPRGG